METDNVIIRRATDQDIKYAEEISAETRASALVRGIGISERPASVIAAKIQEGKAVIAVLEDGRWVGFIYYQPYMDGKFISQSGLIVSPANLSGCQVKVCQCEKVDSSDRDGVYRIFLKPGRYELQVFRSGTLLKRRIVEIPPVEFYEVDFW